MEGDVGLGSQEAGDGGGAGGAEGLDVGGDVVRGADGAEVDPPVVGEGVDRVRSSGRHQRRQVVVERVGPQPGRTALLDELTASGEVAWVGDGGIGDSDGWVRWYVAGAEPSAVRSAPAHHRGQELLDALAPSASSPVVRVRATGGTVVAHLGEHFREGTTDRGAEVAGLWAR